MTLPRLIGITGRAGSGKDTLADHLAAKYGYHKYALASPLKKLLNARFGWTDAMWNDRLWKESPNAEAGHRWSAGAKVEFSPRSWAQWLGTDVVRNLCGEDVWADLMEHEWFNVDTYADVPCMVVPDVRFDNEARRIAALGGIVLRVVRPGVAPVSPHSSEAGVSDTDVNHTVTNDLTIDFFLQESERVLRLAAAELT